MRTLFILRGAPASGKSTWIKENNLEPYTISTDTLRLMYQSPITNLDGTQAISQNHDKEVWEMVMSLMERRMKNGELIIVDATHYKAPLINRYKDLVDKYRYRVYVVDFTNISKEELIERNSKRGFRTVPNEVIEKMYVALQDDSEVKKSCSIVTPEDAARMISCPVSPTIFQEEKIVIFGDIHGCYDPLKQYFDKYPFNENTRYIFCGDYLDRGPQNKEVLEFLISIYNKKNVTLLEGNHEAWLRIYADKDYNIEDYNTEFTYKNLFVDRAIGQLKFRLQTLEKKIRQNTSKAEELYRLSNEANSKIIYYEFEEINVSDERKKLFLEIDKCKEQVKKIEKYINMLNHEEYCTKEYLQHVQERFKEMFNMELSLNIQNVLTDKYGAVKKENPIKSMEFLKRTLPQIKDVDKVQIRQLCRKFSQMSYFEYESSKGTATRYFVTHGGLPCLPTLKTPAIEMIKGVGKYEDSQMVDKTFMENTPCTVQIHGHRNVFNEGVYQRNGFVYNLEQKIECGGGLAIVEIEKDCISNYILSNLNFVKEEPQVVEEKSDIDILKEMYKSKWIQVKNLKDNVVSFNFTRDAFEKNHWNECTCTARGLFVDKTNGDVVARSYPKFFNYSQVDETKAPALKENLTFPVVGYRKENGFLGLVSKHNGEIYFFTKSSDDGDFVNWFIGTLCDNYNIRSHNLPERYKRIYTKYLRFCDKYKNDDAYKDDFKTMVSDLVYLKLQLHLHLKNLLKEGYTYIFECVDNELDPHMIRYNKPTVFLLDVVKNQLKNEFLSYEQVQEEADKLNVPVKKKELTFNNWEEFVEWKDKFRHGITQWDCKHEGYVLEDQNGFRVKFKSSFYTFWKQMRTIKQQIEKGRNLSKIYKTKEEIEVVKLLQSIPKEELQKMSIIDIEEMYYGGK